MFSNFRKIPSITFYDCIFQPPTISLVFVILFFGAFSSNSSASELDGDWSLSLKSGTPAWLSIKRIDGKPVIKMRLHVGPEGPQTNIKEVNGRLSFTLKQNKKQKDTKTVDLGIKSGKLEGVIISTSMDGTVTETPFTGKKIPPRFINPSRPRQSALWASPFLFSMAGTSPVGVPTKRIKSMAGASKTDSSLTRPQRPTSVPPALTQIFAPMPFTKTSGCNIEFLVQEKSNSGVYLRGNVRGASRGSGQPHAGLARGRLCLRTHRPRRKMPARKGVNGKATISPWSTDTSLSS